MKLLLDTHLLLWAAEGIGLSPRAVSLINDEDNALHFSAASIWEIAIKSSLGKPDFSVEPNLFRRALLESGYKEVPITGAHSVGVSTLQDLHKDPFDRILIAQAITEGIILLSADPAVLSYPGPIMSAL